VSEKCAIFDIAECTKIVCRRAPPGPAEELTALPQTPLVAFDGPASKRGEGSGGEERGG